MSSMTLFTIQTIDLYSIERTVGKTKTDGQNGGDSPEIHRRETVMAYTLTKSFLISVGKYELLNPFHRK